MIQYSNGGRLVQSLDELPRLHNADELYLDFETQSGDPKVPALRPYHGHRIAGICVTADEHPGSWYVPVRCAYSRWNLPLDQTLAWLRDVVGTCKAWVNHNVKFDAHFALQDGVMFNGKLVDTLTLSKIVESDRFSYGLDELSEKWLEEDIAPYDKRLQAFLKGCKSKDYGDVPGDIIGEYGCQDVLTTRKLYRYLLRRRHEQTEKVWHTEVLLTPVLFDMEVTGMHVDKTELMVKQYETLNSMLQLEEQLHTATGFAIRPHTNDDCYEVLCNKYGLPVLGLTENGDPSFDKDALTSYLAHPVVRSSPELTDIVMKIRKYRKLHTLNGLFLETFLREQVDGVMHPDYNQAVRTGRMSCRTPNAQQNSKEAKALVHPAPGCDFGSFDLSQIEFRLIAHYIRDERAIAAYAENPDTDFHQWVAEMCGIPRRPAKNVNFAMGFGGGKKRIVSMLAGNMELVGNLSARVDELVAEGKIDESQRQTMFSALCLARGEQVFAQYHGALPTLKQTSARAARNLELRGYVFNAYGRHRHLPPKAAFRAFNSIIQSTAADVMKDCTVQLAPRYNKWTRDHGITLCASVHDETLTNIPKEISHDPAVLSEIGRIIEHPSIEFRVPIRTSCGVSSNNWAEASSDAGKVELLR